MKILEALLLGEYEHSSTLDEELWINSRNNRRNRLLPRKKEDGEDNVCKDKEPANNNARWTTIRAVRRAINKQVVGTDSPADRAFLKQYGVSAKSVAEIRQRRNQLTRNHVPALPAQTNHMSEKPVLGAFASSRGVVLFQQDDESFKLTTHPKSTAD